MSRLKTIITIQYKKKEFDSALFAADLLVFINELDMKRPDFAKQFNTKAAIITSILNTHVAPRLELAYNLCTAMGKTLDDYFVEVK